MIRQTYPSSPDTGHLSERVAHKDLSEQTRTQKSHLRSQGVVAHLSSSYSTSGGGFYCHSSFCGHAGTASDDDEAASSADYCQRSSWSSYYCGTDCCCLWYDLLSSLMTCAPSLACCSCCHKSACCGNLSRLNCPSSSASKHGASAGLSGTSLHVYRGSSTAESY